MQHCIVSQKFTDVSEVLNVSIIRVMSSDETSVHFRETTRLKSQKTVIFIPAAVGT
jgi:hypothetical protein